MIAPRRTWADLAWECFGLGFGAAFVALMILWLVTDTREVDAWIIAHRPF